ncbi:MAG TPA: recombination mediator RecR [Polyangiaceae bacterium]|nr:recombination mediator RecR [Polyangiaceae bacterium]
MLPDRLRVLTQLLARLPGVGEKTAQRYVLHLASEGGSLSAELGAELASLAEHVRPCTRCGNLAEVDGAEPPICAVCSDSRRDGSLLCVVARVQDLLAIERSSSMRGRYFVLGKLLSPLDGVGPDELPLGRLAARVREDSVKEVIVATPPSVDGEATALLLARELAPLGVSVSRIASGVPHGGDLEFSDQITLGRAIAGRRAVDGSR